MLVAVGKKIITVHNPGKPYEERQDYAECDDPHKAIRLLEKAWHLNDVKRQYTAAARLIAEAEELPGFKWLNC